MHRAAKSGSEPEGTTERQREILRLVPFLRRHIKTSASLTTYKGASPAPTAVLAQSTPRQQPSKKVLF